MFGMKRAIYGGGEEGEEEGEEDDDEVEKLQAMMLRMQAVRGTFQFCIRSGVRGEECDKVLTLTW